MAQDTRYASHLALEGVGIIGHERIRSARVLLTGVGGLGCPVAQYLAAAGIGELLLADFDRVSESNLARQLLFGPQDIGRLKVDVARDRLSQQNPDVSIRTHDQRVTREYLRGVINEFDLLIDASDNYGTRLDINRACLDSGQSWVMGACVRLEGQVILFDPDSACYRCVYGATPETLEDCPGAGIFAPVAGMIGTTMAQLALARLAGLDTPSGLHLLDAERLNWKTMKVIPDPECPECGKPRGANN